MSDDIYENAKRNGDNPIYQVSQGLTKKEYLSSIALQGILSNQSLIDKIIKPGEDNYISFLINRVSMISVDFADELLLQLDNTEE